VLELVIAEEAEGTSVWVGTEVKEVVVDVWGGQSCVVRFYQFLLFLFFGCRLWTNTYFKRGLRSTTLVPACET